MTKTRRLTLIALLSLLVWGAAGACVNFFEKPGEGEKAQQGYQACAPLIAALEQYRQQKNEYPNTLTQLVPAWLPALDPAVDTLGIRYARAGASYSLQFSYTGPGMNRCSYTPETNWSCQGYY